MRLEMAFALVALAVTATAGACGGAAAPSSANADGSGCSTLGTCCSELSGNLASLCNEIVSAGNGQDCATELGQLQTEGDCLNVNATTDASVGSGSTSPQQPPSCAGIKCASPLVCNALPGSNTPTCVAKCQSNADCPGLATCQDGLCSVECSSCPPGQACGESVRPVPRPCSSNADCGFGAYCQTPGPAGQGMCRGYFACMPCMGGCMTCTANSQCDVGQVCINHACTTCTSNSQCGPSAVCAATHTGMQCTCTMDSDCAAGEACNSGICQFAPPPPGGCSELGCQNGQVCVNNACGACSSSIECDTQPGEPVSGLVCTNGTCGNCTANRQCGGGMACVQGTCGTCSASSQCGASGTCTDGFCTCKSNADCDTGQRCGSGVCVAM